MNREKSIFVVMCSSTVVTYIKVDVMAIKVKIALYTDWPRDFHGKELPM